MRNWSYYIIETDKRLFSIFPLAVFPKSAVIGLHHSNFLHRNTCNAWHTILNPQVSCIFIFFKLSASACVTELMLRSFKFPFWHPEAYLLVNVVYNIISNVVISHVVFRSIVLSSKIECLFFIWIRLGFLPKN